MGKYSCARGSTCRCTTNTSLLDTPALHTCTSCSWNDPRMAEYPDGSGGGGAAEVVRGRADWGSRDRCSAVIIWGCGGTGAATASAPLACTCHDSTVENGQRERGMPAPRCPPAHARQRGAGTCHAGSHCGRLAGRARRARPSSRGSSARCRGGTRARSSGRRLKGRHGVSACLHAAGQRPTHPALPVR